MQASYVFLLSGSALNVHSHSGPSSCQLVLIEMVEHVLTLKGEQHSGTSQGQEVVSIRGISRREDNELKLRRWEWRSQKFDLHTVQSVNTKGPGRVVAGQSSGLGKFVVQ